MSEHEQLPNGESTAKWAMRQPGFFGTTRQLLDCARCGGNLPPKRRDEPMHCFDVLKPTEHFVCDDCFDVLPE